MREMSNSTLAILVLLAIVVSVGGTLLSLNKLNQLGGIGGFTGLVTYNATGKANLTIPALATINVTDTVIQLGTISVSIPSLNITNTSDTKNDWWVVRNDGSGNITIRIYSDPADDQNRQTGQGISLPGRGPFVSGAQTIGCLNGSTTLLRCFLVKCHNFTNLTNATFSWCNTTYDALPLSTGGTTSRILVMNLSQIDGNDTAWFGVNVTTPNGETAADLSQNVVFYAEKA